MLHISGVPLVDHLESYLSENYALQEREYVRTYVKSSAQVLEVGARFGAVSCEINEMLRDKSKHVVFEPDSIVWSVLERNKRLTKSDFVIWKGTLSENPCHLVFRGGGLLGGTKRYREHEMDDSCSSTTTENITYNDFKKRYFTPDTLVMDCEGAYGQIFTQFPNLLDDVHTIIIDWDGDDGDIKKDWRNYLLVKGFQEIQKGIYVK